MGLLQVVSLHFDGWYNNKGLEIYVCTLPILIEPHYICVSLVMCSNICILFIIIVIALQPCFSNMLEHQKGTRDFLRDC